MVYLSKREQKIFFVCLALFFFYVAQFWVIGPLCRYAKRLDEKIIVVQKDISKNLRVIHRAEVIKNRYEKYLAIFKQKVPEEEVMASLISDIETIANQLSFSINDLKPQKVRREGRLNYFPISLEFSCNFRTLALFLRALYDYEYLFQVEELRVDTTGTGEDEMLKVYLILKKAFAAQ